MIIVDRDAESKLTLMLERIKSQSLNARCIYFDLKNDFQLFPGIREYMVTATRSRIPSVDIQVYLCGDGDIFILAPTIQGKDAHALMLDIANYLDKPSNENWACFVELPVNINKPLAIAEEKIKTLRQAEEERRKQFEQRQAERKRYAILSGAGIPTAETIETRRSNRVKPELMIVEDDPFTRRLLDNVLQQQYALTGLGEADYALETYARIAPDLLFLDINLPDVNGHELLEKLMQLDPHAYVVMLSGNSDIENITQAMRLGAKGFIAKPFTKEKIFQYIERCPNILHKQSSDI